VLEGDGCIRAKMKVIPQNVRFVYIQETSNPQLLHPQAF